MLPVSSSPKVYQHLLIPRVHREGTTGRTLPNGVTTTGGSSAMTVDLCTSACQTAGYLLAGLEYAGECCNISSHPT
jgi:hypothetical protein